MADWKKQVEILPSLLDRLTDLEPRNRNEAPVLMAQGMRLLKQNIRRDIEWLLNSRRQIQSPPEWCRELNYSLYEYGLPDLTSMALNTSRDQAKLSSLIENAIAVFEPRLRNVVVSMVPVAGNNRVLRFQIEGLLRVEPGPERIQFDTTLDLTSGTYNVEGDAGAR
jgi:type VI secretion system protein ImpF